MRIQFNLRTLAVVVLLFSLFFAVRFRSVANANRFRQSIAEMNSETKERLFSDANLSPTRFTLSTGALWLDPKIELTPTSFADFMLMRSNYRVEFKTNDKNYIQYPGAPYSIFDDLHQSDYQIDCFAVRFLRSTRNPN